MPRTDEAFAWLATHEENCGGGLDLWVRQQASKEAAMPTQRSRNRDALRTRLFWGRQPWKMVHLDLERRVAGEYSRQVHDQALGRHLGRPRNEQRRLHILRFSVTNSRTQTCMQNTKL